MGYHLITSRQVYLFDEFDSCQHKDYKRDVKLLNDGRFIFRTCQSEEDYRQAVHWYNRLYLQKYSLQNVQFTPKGLQVFHKYHLVDLELLIDANTNQSCGVLGVVTDDTEHAYRWLRHRRTTIVGAISAGHRKSNAKRTNFRATTEFKLGCTRL